ncbi:MAG TPA: response regulator transcription factor [Chitinophagaceae bacterium]|nr:response regulator transcription factor [Chitinophagaceae bacterium]
MMPSKHYKANILLVEDEESLREALKLNLEMEAYEVTSVGNGKAALKAFQEEYFDCIILDIMMPEIDGLMVCESIRLSNDKVPILFLSARSSGADRVMGLKKGGDDYLTKPFNLEELLLRVDKLIQKNKQLDKGSNDWNVYEIGKGRIDLQAQECTDIHGKKHALTKKELQFLKLLIDHKNEVVSREYILKMVWGFNVFPTTRTIDNFIMTYRKYFEENPRNPQHFISIRGTGYKFTG